MKFERYHKKEPPEKLQMIGMNSIYQRPVLCGVNADGLALAQGNIAEITPEANYTFMMVVRFQVFKQMREAES